MSFCQNLVTHCNELIRAEANIITLDFFIYLFGYTSTQRYTVRHFFCMLLTYFGISYRFKGISVIT